MKNSSKSGPNSKRKSEILAREARGLILNATSKSGASHVASCLSVVDILAVIYHDIANIELQSIRDPKRDRVILSKGHAAAALYSVLSLKGFFDVMELDYYCKDGANLSGHVTHKNNPGVELSTGSLGHGLPYGLGIAAALKRQGNTTSRVFVIMSDGECDEGTTWESALIASHLELDNLVVIIDRNRLQSLADTEKTIALEPLAEKWLSFNWDTKSINGHSHSELEESMLPDNRPKCIIANTTKGKGVSFMENSVLWHYKSPDETELRDALREIEI